MLVRVRHRRLSWFRPALGCLVVALLLGFAPHAVPSPTVRSAQAQVSLRPSGQIGGASGALLVVGDVAWVAEGPRVVAYGVAADGSTQGSDEVLPRLATGPILPGVVRDLSMVDDHLVVAAGPEGGVIVLDVSDVSNVAIVGSLDTPGAAAGVAALDSRVAVADGGEGLLWLDLEDPSWPSVLATVPLVGFAAQVTIVADHAVVAMGRAPWDATWPGSEGSLAVVDLIRRDEPILRAMLEPGGAPMALTADGELAYAAVRRPAAEERPADEALVVVDVDGPGDGDNEPRLLGAGIIGDGLDRDGLATGLAPFGRYVLAGGARVRVVDLYDSTQPVLLRRLDAPAAAIALSPAGAVLAVPRGGIALHATGRGGQLYHRATRHAPGMAVDVVPWRDAAAVGGDPPERSAVALADRHGLWRVRSEVDAAPGSARLEAVGTPFEVAKGSVRHAVAIERENDYEGPPGALLLVEGGPAGARLEVVEDGDGGPRGRGVWLGALAPDGVAALRKGPHAILLDTAEAIAAPGALSLHVIDLQDMVHPARVAAVPDVAGAAVATWHEVVFTLGETLSSWYLGDHPLEDHDGPAVPRRLGTLAGPADTLAVVDGTVYTHDGDVVRVIDAVDPTAMREQDRWPLSGPPRGIDVDERWLAVALGASGVALVDRQAGPESMARFETAGEALAVLLDGDHLWVADGDGGLLQLAIANQAVAPSPTVAVGRTDTGSMPPRPVAQAEQPNAASQGGSSANDPARRNSWTTNVASVAKVASVAAGGDPPIHVEHTVGGEIAAIAIERGGSACVGQGLRVACGADVATARGRLSRATALTGVVRDLAWGILDAEGDGRTGRRLVYAALSGEGLQVLEYDAATGTLRSRGFMPLPSAQAIAVEPVVIADARVTRGARTSGLDDLLGDPVWVATGASGSLQRVVTADPDAPLVDVVLQVDGEAGAVMWAGGDLYVAGGSAGLVIYDGATLGEDTSAPLATLELPGGALGLAWRSVQGPYVIVAAGVAGVHAVDVTAPSRPVLAWTGAQPIAPPLGPVGTTDAVAVMEPFIVAAGRYDPAAAGAGLRLWLPRADADPLPVAMLALPGEARAIAPNPTGPLAGSSGWVALGDGGLVPFELHILAADDIRITVDGGGATPGRAAGADVDADGALWLGEIGDRPRIWRAIVGAETGFAVESGISMALSPIELAASGTTRAWTLFEGGVLRTLDVGEGSGTAAPTLGRSAVLPAPGAIALTARSDEAAWVAPAPEGSLEPDLRLVGLGKGSNLAVTRRQRLPGAARDVALPGSPGSVLVAGDEAGLLAIQLAEAGRTPIVWDGALDAPARRVALAEDTVWVDDGRGLLHRLWLEKPALPKLLGSIALPDAAPLRDLDAGRDGAWLVLADGAVGFVDATVAITKTTLLTATLPAPALQIAATDDGARAVAAAGAAGWVGLRSPLAEPGGPARPPAIFIPKAER